MDYVAAIEKLNLITGEYLSTGKSLRDLSSEYKISRGVISGFLLARGIDIYSKKSHVNNYAFSYIETEEEAYWLGFLYADGCVHAYQKSRNIELTLKESDKEHLEKFARFVDYTGKIKYRKAQKAYRVSFGSTKMFNDLVSHGCIQNKSLILKFPSEKDVPNYLIRHFIRGYFDGDGCIECIPRKRDNSFRKIVSLLGTKEFLTSVLEHLPFEVGELDIIKKCKNNNSNNYYFFLRTAESLKFLDFIYSNATVYLERKYHKYLL